MKSIKEILNLIKDEDLETEDADLVAYEYIKDHFAAYKTNPSSKDAKLFEFIYANFYRLMRGIKKEDQTGYMNVYFELLRRGEENVEKIVDELKTITERHEFSFSTKLAHTNNPEVNPIYDGFVAEVIGRSKNYSELKELYGRLINDPECEAMIITWRKHHSAYNITKLKILDFIFWKAGERLTKKKKDDGANETG